MGGQTETQPQRHIVERIMRPVHAKSGGGAIPLAACAVAAGLLPLIPAFGDALWYDESYSVALVGHNPRDIWTLGAQDVHPIGYYMLLAVVRAVFGGNFVAYRILSVVGIWLAAAVGAMALRRMFGARAGYVFALLVCCCPFLGQMAVQIRMYSWAVFAMTACFMAAMSICLTARRGRSPQLFSWAAFALAGVCGAYLHYYAAVTDFLINVIVLVVCCRNRRRSLVMAFVVQAVAQVALYAPWLIVMFSQVSRVSGGYWITFSFPQSLVEILGYPMAIAGTPMWLGAVLCMVLAAGGIAMMVLRRGRDAAPRLRKRRAISGTDHRFVSICGVAVYVGLLAFAGAASVILQQDVLMYRYLVVALTAPLASLAIVVTAVWETSEAGSSIRRLIGACAALLAVCATMNVGLLAYRSSSPRNAEPMDAIGHAVASASGHVAVLSDTPRAMGVLSVTHPELDNVYCSWTERAWWDQGALAAFDESLRVADDWRQAVGNADEVVFVRSASPGDHDVLADVDVVPGLRKIDERTYLHPWDWEYWTIGWYEVDGPVGSGTNAAADAAQTEESASSARGMGDSDA